VSNQGLHAVSSARRRTILELRDDIQQVVADIIADGTATDVFAPSASRLVLFYILSANIGVARWYSPSGGLSADQIADHHAECALRLVRKPSR
jgi:hypothetical protein